MKRRGFFGSGFAVGAAAASVSCTESVSSAPVKPKKALMYPGTQFDLQTDEGMNFLVRHGIANKVGYPKVTGRNYTLEDLHKLIDFCDKYGIRIDIVPLPLAEMTARDAQAPDFMLCKCSEGDRQIDLICEMIRTTAKAGIPAIKYFLCESPNQRTESVPLGRGGLRYSTWDLEKAKAENRPPYKVPVSLDVNWERITYFLERVIPVATEYKIRMACHPCDPWVPPGYRGITRALSDFEGFKRFIEINPSPYHGLNLCLGCYAESCDNPANEVPEVIRYFGLRKKIFLIHYRNIIGKRNKFQEVFQDNGVMNMHRIMQVMKEVEYPHMFVEDHAPGHPEDLGGRQALAFQWGYMIAMLQAVNDEA